MKICQMTPACGMYRYLLVRLQKGRLFLPRHPPVHLPTQALNVLGLLALLSTVAAKHYYDLHDQLRQFRQSKSFLVEAPYPTPWRNQDIHEVFPRE